MSGDDNASLMSAQEGSAAAVEPFAPSELVVCEECRRANSPNRPSCIYCGAQLSARVADQIEVRTDSSPTSETATEYLFLPPEQLPKAAASADQIAALLGIKPEEMLSAIGAGGPLPLFAASTVDEQTKFAGEVETLGLELVGIPREVTLNGSWMKLRGLEFSEDTIAPIAKGSTDACFPWSDLVQVVSGRIIRNRVELEEKRQRGRLKQLGSRHLTADELLIDLYFKPPADAWRIYANTFDFSCLQAEKRVTAFENSAALLKLIRECALNVEIDDSFNRKRSLLASVWPIETDSKSEWSPIIRQKFNFMTVTTVDNESQFDRYSRALQYLRCKALESTE